MGATAVTANLKIKFDVFIEIRGRRRRGGSCRRRVYTCNPSQLGLRDGGRGARGFNSTVTNDGS